MRRYKMPLKKNFLIAVITFLISLSILIALLEYLNYRHALYRGYKFHIQDILNYTASGIDKDDLAECIRSGKKSEKYYQLQHFIDGIKDNTSIHFLYIVIPENTAETDNMKNVIAAVSQEEYLYESDELVDLNQPTGDAYTPATARKYLDAYKSGKLSFFESESPWGYDYTGLLPLYDSKGNLFAALCVDVDINIIHTSLIHNIIFMISIIILVGAAFGIFFLWWIHRNMIRPIEELEKSAADFALICQEEVDPEAIVIDLPEINQDNEIKSLSLAIKDMTLAIRIYLENFIYAEDELAKMTILANKDALTNIRNKTAYDTYITGLQDRLDRDPFPFAILMADLNYLKQVNDCYGHEKGDEYIKACCAILCDIYDHSPVFRMGGDEFTVILTGQDYERRDKLLNLARQTFNTNVHSEDVDPLAKPSVALGMADYREGIDHTIQDVQMRADHNMYEEKRRMKIQR